RQQDRDDNHRDHDPFRATEYFPQNRKLKQSESVSSALRLRPREYNRRRYKHLPLLRLLFAFVPLYGFVHHTTADYKKIELQGHPVYLSPEAVSSADLLDRVIAKLDSDLTLIHGVLPATAVTKIGNVSFW